MTTEFSKWNKAVPDYDSLQESVINSINKKEGQQLTCVELGVGKGGTAHFLFERFPDVKYTGVDSSVDAVQHCIELFKEKTGASISVSDIRGFEFPADSDAIISVLTIHHLNKEEKSIIFKSAFDSLREGGVFVIGDIVKDEDETKDQTNRKARADYRDRVCSDEEKELMKKHLAEYPHIFETEKDTVDMLQAAGFKEISTVWSNFGMSVFKAVKV